MIMIDKQWLWLIMIMMINNDYDDKQRTPVRGERGVWPERGVCPDRGVRYPWNTNNYSYIQNNNNKNNNNNNNYFNIIIQ